MVLDYLLNNILYDTILKDVIEIRPCPVFSPEFKLSEQQYLLISGRVVTHDLRGAADAGRCEDHGEVRIPHLSKDRAPGEQFLMSLSNKL